MDNDDDDHGWDDNDDWDDDDYEEFVEREFPDSSDRAARSGTNVPAIWKWTAWMLLAVILLFWVWSTGI